MNVRLTYLHDPEKTYLVRVCVAVESAVTVTENSSIANCMECDIAVWYDEDQVIPPPPPDIVFEPQEVVLCLRCAALHATIEDKS